MQGDIFRLYVNGAAIPALRGTVKDYTAAGIPIPYNQRNFLFLGDNTTSARASVQIARVALSAGVASIGVVAGTPQPIGPIPPPTTHTPSQPR